MSKHKDYPAARLGYGFDPYEPWKDKTASGIFSWTEEGATEPGGAKISFDLYSASSEQELMKALSVDVAAKVKMGLSEGNIAAKFSLNESFEENSFSLILKGMIVFNTEKKKGELQLTEKGKSLLGDGKDTASLRNFYRAAGTEVVSAQTRAASISVIYTYHTTSAEKKTKLQLVMSAKHGSMSGSVNLNQEMASVDKTARLSVTAYQEGATVSGTNIFDILSAQPGNFDAIRATIQESLKSVTADKCEISDIILIDIADNFGLDEFRNPFLVGRANRTLEQLFYDYNRHKILANRIRGALAGLQFDDYSDNGKALLKAASSDVLARLHLIEEEGAQLLSNPEFMISEKDDIEIPWNAILSGPWFELQSWAVSTSAGQWWNKYHWDATAVYVPNVRFKKLPLITGGVLFRNGVPVEPLSYEEISKIAEQSGSFKDIYSVSHTVSQEWIWEGTPYAAAYADAANRALSKGNGIEKSSNYRIEINTHYGESFEILFGGHGSA